MKHSRGTLALLLGVVGLSHYGCTVDTKSNAESKAGNGGARSEAAAGTPHSDAGAGADQSTAVEGSAAGFAGEAAGGSSGGAADGDAGAGGGGPDECVRNSTQTAWNLTTDYSNSTNSCGVWTYGYTATLGSPFVPYTQIFQGPACGIEDFRSWGQVTSAGEPALALLADGATATMNVGSHLGRNDGTITCYDTLVGQFFLHPGPSGEYTTVRWTAPLAGTFAFSATWMVGSAVHGTSKDAVVMHDGAVLYESATSTNPTFQKTLTMAAGDTFDVAVGTTASENWFFGTTPVTLTVTRQ